SVAAHAADNRRADEPAPPGEAHLAGVAASPTFGAIGVWASPASSSAWPVLVVLVIIPSSSATRPVLVVLIVIPSSAWPVVVAILVRAPATWGQVLFGSHGLLRLGDVRLVVRRSRFPSRGRRLQTD